MKAVIGVITAAVVVFFGWSIWYAVTMPDTGVVTGRQFHPAYTTPGYYLSSCTTTDKGAMHCSNTWVAPVYHAECYEVAYYNEEADRNGWACVAPQLFEHYERGVQYP